MVNLKNFFEPERIAVIGASRNPSKIGHVIFKNILDGKFRGEVIPVNPNADDILGHKSYPSVSKIEEKGLPYSVQISIFEDVFTVGVQGDNRTYYPLVEVTLLKNGKVVYNKNLAHELGTEIPNKVRNTNRVVVTILQIKI